MEVSTDAVATAVTVCKTVTGPRLVGSACNEEVRELDVEEKVVVERVEVEELGKLVGVEEENCTNTVLT